MALRDHPRTSSGRAPSPDSATSSSRSPRRGWRNQGPPTGFIIAREDADPDVLWNLEVFRSDEAKDAYEGSPLADELRDQIIGLLAEPPMRIKVHPYSALPADRD